MDKNETNILSAFITFLILVVFLVSCNGITQNASNNNSTQQQTQKDNSQYKTERLNLIQNYINEFVKARIFRNIKRGNDEISGRYMEIQVDEYAWNNLPYDAKVATDNMFLEYWELTNEVVIFRGYRTGKILHSMKDSFKL